MSNDNTSNNATGSIKTKKWKHPLGEQDMGKIMVRVKYRSGKEENINILYSKLWDLMSRPSILELTMLKNKKDIMK
ncbi:hypothetical protein CL614_09680 [archaeon]|nr:hypothetical protein [archaeon]